MADKEINQLIVAAIINLSIVAFLVNKAWNGNDKAIILVIFFYPVLIIANSIFWMGSKSKAYKITTIGLLILFLPVLIIASWYWTNERQKNTGLEYATAGLPIYPDPIASVPNPITPQPYTSSVPNPWDHREKHSPQVPCFFPGRNSPLTQASLSSSAGIMEMYWGNTHFIRASVWPDAMGLQTVKYQRIAGHSFLLFYYYHAIYYKI